MCARPKLDLHTRGPSPLNQLSASKLAPCNGLRHEPRFRGCAHDDGLVPTTSAAAAARAAVTVSAA
jgi:hypothetical protein